MKEVSKHIEAELRKAPTLLALKQFESVFAVPANYFETFPERILDKAQADPRDEAAVFGDGQSLSQMPQEQLFDAPKDYFSDFQARLADKIDAEIEEPLKAFKGKQIFQVPEAYFETFSQKLQQNIEAPQQETKVFSLRSTWVMRIAAGLVLLLGVGALIWLQPNAEMTYVELHNEQVTEEAFFAMVSAENFALDELALQLSAEELAVLEEEIAPIVPAEDLDIFLEDLDLSELEDMEAELF